MRLFQIDSFTQEIFKGNPAGVCLVDRVLSSEKMQMIASEMNLSETAFIEQKESKYGLRWFTPAQEVPLCGHATLASAFVLFNEGIHPKNESIVFETLSGDLIIHYQADDSLLMDFPMRLPEAYTGGKNEQIKRAFGDSIKEVLQVPDELIVILNSAEAIRSADPPSDIIAELAVNGVMVSGWDNTGEYDFVSRYFAPNLGIREDPVTGFIHTILSPYWAKQKDQQSFKCFQASARGGELLVSINEDRVHIQGHAIKVFETVLLY